MSLKDEVETVRWVIAMMSKLRLAPDVTLPEWCKLYYSLALIKALSNSRGDSTNTGTEEVETVEFAAALRELMSSGSTEYCAHRFTLDEKTGLLEISDLRN
jgi:hypothetical protein